MNLRYDKAVPQRKMQLAIESTKQIADCLIC